VSKHYEKNVTCTSCHDPHTSGVLTVSSGIPAGANAPTNGVYGVTLYDNAVGATNFARWDGEGLKAGVTCTTCHVGADPKHVHYFTPKAMAAAINCVDCHMPDVINVNTATLRGALHPHTFRSMRPEISQKYGADNQANSCTYSCHQDEGSTKTERAQWAASYLQSHLQLVSVSATATSLRLTGLRNFSYTIEGSRDFTTWLPISTNKADVNGLLNFQDNASSGSYKFYRASEK
jgi:hypothetical protein